MWHIRGRRKGTALVEAKRGVLMVSKNGDSFILPGGGAHRYESRKDAAGRELREETGLVALRSSFLFGIIGGVWRDSGGRRVRNLHKVYLIEAKGTPRPDGKEIRYIRYWKPGSRMKLGYTTGRIIDRYLRMQRLER